MAENQTDLKQQREELAAKLPLLTSRLDVDLNLNKLFSKYSIVSYSGLDPETRKQLAYAELADIPCLGEAGLRLVPKNYPHSQQTYFLLCLRGQEQGIINALRKYPWLRCSTDDLSAYTDMDQKRIFCSLAFNSISHSPKSNSLSAIGQLIVTDTINFDSDSENALLGLAVSVDPYLNLCLATNTFIHPREAKLLKKGDPIFMETSAIDGKLWNGRTIKPVRFSDIPADPDLDKYYILHREFKGKNNTVPYWIYDIEKYTHGKLFVFLQLVETVNDMYEGILNVSFHEYKVWKCSEKPTDDHTMEVIKSFFKDKRIFFENPFATHPDNASVADKTIERIKKLTQEILKPVNSVCFADAPADADMIIKLVDPINKKGDLYTKGDERGDYSGIPLQHVIIYPAKKRTKGTKAQKDDNEESTTKMSDMAAEHPAASDCGQKPDEGKEGKTTDKEEKEKSISNKSEVRRILLDLYIKDCDKKGYFPKGFIDEFGDWEYYRYKINKGNVYGVKLVIEGDRLKYTDYGYNYTNTVYPFEDFFTENFGYHNPLAFKGSQDYMAMKRNGNEYMIINTSEIPILDGRRIEEGYEKIRQGIVQPSFFKNIYKGINGPDPVNNYKYFSGCIGLHIWTTEPLKGDTQISYSYLCGRNSVNIQMKQSRDNSRLVQVPHVHKIFVLNAARPGSIETDILDIMSMLGYGFSRWNEQMTYPFPFKIMLEHLDEASERYFKRHWDQMTYEKEL